MQETISMPEIREKLAQIINDFSQLLEDRKKLGTRQLKLSDESLKLITSWNGVVQRREQHSQIINRTKFYYKGSDRARLVVIDSNGTFFEGPAGNLLMKIIRAMHLEPDQIWICDVKMPSSSIKKKIHEIRPEVIISLGETAGRIVATTSACLDNFQGSFVKFCGIPAMPLYHPKLLLEHPEMKRPVWEAIKKVIMRLSLC